MIEKTIVVYSGGLDSTVLLAKLLREGNEIKALSFNYGQRHAKELIVAQTICAELGVKHEIADLQGITPLIEGTSSQVGTSVDVPHGQYDDDVMKTTIVPNRNMIMLAVAAGHALAKGYTRVAYAAHAGDHAIYPDCRKDFVLVMQSALGLCDDPGPELYAPFVDIRKEDIVKIGHEVQAPMSKTWSCYEGKVVHCGKCGTCVERKEAFDLAGVTDMTIYKD